MIAGGGDFQYVQRRPRGSHRIYSTAAIGQSLSAGVEAGARDAQHDASDLARNEAAERVLGWKNELVLLATESWKKYTKTKRRIYVAAITEIKDMPKAFARGPNFFILIAKKTRENKKS